MAEDEIPPDKLKQFEDRLAYLEVVARETVARLYAIERHLNIVFRAVPKELQGPEARPQPSAPKPTEPQRPSISQTPPVSSIQPPAIPPAQPGTQKPPAPGVPSSAPPTSHPAYQKILGSPAQPSASSAGGTTRAPGQPAQWPAPTPTRKIDLEARIGGNWFNRIGVLAIFLGVAFFLKYAFDKNWIGPAGRVLIAAAIGIAFILGGENLRKKYATYAYGLTGGGIAVLYATIWFASFQQYDLINSKTSFALMALVTATASLLAARYSALPIAILGVLGGFLTPILLSTGVDNETGLFSYIALLDLGVLALAYRKQWRSLNYLSFIATVLMFAAWLEEWYDPTKLGTTVLFLTVFFVIFALLAVIYNVVNLRRTTWLDLTMVFANALLYFATTYALLNRHIEYRRLLGGFAVLVAAFYLLLGFVTYRRDREDSLLVFTFLGLGFLFSVLAVPIQFEQQWITMAWAVEGAVMTWIGLRARDRTSRYAGLVVFIIAISHWILSDVADFAYVPAGHFVPLLNKRALSCGVLIASLAAAALFYRRYGDERSTFSGLLNLTANGLAIALLTIDANDYFEQRKTALTGQDAAGSLANSKALTITALWTIYGVGILFAGLRGRLKPLRFLGLLLLTGATVKVLFVDLFYANASWHTLIVNQTFIAFALVIASLYLAAVLYSRGESIDDEERDIGVPLLVSAANVVAVIALSAEVWGHFARIEADSAGIDIARLENTKQFVLSAVWTVYAAVTMLVGIRRGARAVRFGALLLLLITIAKVFVIDITYYDAVWHRLILNQTFATFALLVYVLAWTARAYSRSNLVTEEERTKLVPVLVASANVLALVALSVEALGYYAAKTRAGDVTASGLGDLRLKQQLSLSLVWTAYGGVMLAVGIARRNKLLRMMALGLLGITILKVFLFDLSSLERLYRIISFIVLGAILLAVSFLYQRFRQKSGEFEKEAATTEQTP